MSFLSNKKNAFWVLALGIVCCAGLVWFVFFSGKKTALPDPALAVVIDWHNYALKAEQSSEGFRITTASRVYAYSGIAAWEASRPLLGQSAGLAAASHFKGLNLPAPPTGQQLHLPTVLNACYSEIFHMLFMVAPINIESERKRLEKKWADDQRHKLDTATFSASVAFGKKVAQAVYDWSATDTIGHLAYLHIYDGGFLTSLTDSTWQTNDDFPMPPMHPDWGKTRCFLINPADFVAKAPPPFSLDSKSAYYVQALEVYTMNAPLSPENQWIAEFWSDDYYGLTISPAGRWISITNQVVMRDQPPISKALETYLRVGIALSDATVACWKSKYKYNRLRPETFIRRIIQRDWRPLVHAPSHPSYPSGHAMTASAAAEVLTALYGDNYEMTDRTHENRTEFKGKPRHFHSFFEMAAESASSRIPMGAHYRMDCEEGTRLGLAIGKKIAAAPLQEIE